MKDLALAVPGYNITPPPGIPTGGLHDAQGGAGIIRVGISLLLGVVSILCLFYLVWGGFKWITSGGDPEKVAAARLSIMYAIMGLGISLLSFAIIGVLGTFFKVNLLAF